MNSTLKERDLLHQHRRALDLVSRTPRLNWGQHEAAHPDDMARLLSAYRDGLIRLAGAEGVMCLSAKAKNLLMVVADLNMGARVVEMGDVREASRRILGGDPSTLGLWFEMGGV